MLTYAKRGRRKAAPRASTGMRSPRAATVCRRGVRAPRRLTRRLRSGPLLPAPLSPAYDSETPDEITNEALLRACRAYGLGERFLAAAQEEGTFGEWLDELPIESPSLAPRAGRDRDHGPHSSPEPSDCSAYPGSTLCQESPETRGITQSCVMHALRAGRGAHCASELCVRASPISLAKKTPNGG